MKLEYTPKFRASYKKFPKEIQQKFAKQANYLLKNFRHPSLHTKKYDKIRGIWQARVDRNVRFYFLIRDNKYILLHIVSHPK